MITSHSLSSFHVHRLFGVKSMCYGVRISQPQHPIFGIVEFLTLNTLQIHFSSLCFSSVCSSGVHTMPRYSFSRLRTFFFFTFFIVEIYLPFCRRAFVNWHPVSNDTRNYSHLINIGKYTPPLPNSTENWDHCVFGIGTRRKFRRNFLRFDSSSAAAAAEIRP